MSGKVDPKINPVAVHEIWSSLHETKSTDLHTFASVAQIEHDIYIVRLLFVCNKATANINGFYELRPKFRGKKLKEPRDELRSMLVCSKSRRYLG